MIQKNTLFILFLVFVFGCKSNKNQTDFTTVFEKSKGLETATYEQTIQYYQDLAATYKEISIFTFGQTDAGYPLHLVIYNADEIHNIEDIQKASKNTILINNGIHPGESDGIDATMLLFRELAQNDSLKNQTKNLLIATIPIYNIGGALNRNSFTRANQNGPKSYGFRGNAQNYDLNRDFIKQDTKNAATFAEIFHAINPDVFIDNHVSNGADYQYTLTHLFTQHNKLGGKLGALLEDEMRPSIEKSLQKKGLDITPYVNVWGTTPEAGFSQFFDSPRYSTGYTTLFHTLGLMVETHMLKPYKQRVEQTYELMLAAIDFTTKKGAKIKNLRNNAFQEIITKKTYPIHFQVNDSSFTHLDFKGFEASVIDSKVTNGKRLYYDQSKPFTKTIKYYNQFVPTKFVDVPTFYIIKKGWHPVIDRLKRNQIEMKKLQNDTIIEVETQHIANFETRKMPFEGHYVHYNTSISKTTVKKQFHKGDYLISTNQNGIRYLLETLEPEATDSFFNWNFFDTVLQQKEGYSSYVFEDIAEKLLFENPTLKVAFEKEMLNEDFAKNPQQQLDFIYKNSPYYEESHMQLPIYKIYK